MFMEFIKVKVLYLLSIIEQAQRSELPNRMRVEREAEAISPVYW